MSVLVLGLGNDLLGDDGVGLHVAHLARERLQGDPDVAVHATTEMGLALLDEIAGAKSLVLIDSIQTGSAPAGHIHEFGAAEVGKIRTTSPHLVGIGETLAIGRLLGIAMPADVRVFAIEAANTTELGAKLTPGVEASLMPAADLVVAAALAFARRGAR